MWILPYCLLLVVNVIGLSLPTSMEPIPVVHLSLLHILDPSGFSVSWDPLKTANESNPILGIKVKVWKTPCVMKTVYRASGQLTKIVKLEPEIYNDTTLPDGMPEYVVIVKADEVTATVPHVEVEQWYHVRALAFTEAAEGKHSNSYDFKVSSEDENDKKRACDRIISETIVNSVVS